MAYDERLAERVRQALAEHGDITERKMFGGLAFMSAGKMCIGVVKNDLMVRTGIERYDEALKRKGARPMDFTGRVSKGMVYVGPEGVAGAAALRRWVETGLAGAREATAAPRRAPRKAAKQRRVAR